MPESSNQRIVVLLDSIRSLYNTGSILRTADASGVERIVLCGITPRPDQGGRQRRAIAKTALAAEDSVSWHYDADTSTAVRRFVEEGCGGPHPDAREEALVECGDGGGRGPV